MVVRALIVVVIGLSWATPGWAQGERKRWLDVFSDGQWMVSEESRAFDAPDDEEIYGNELTLQHRYRERTDFAVAHFFGKNTNDQREERTRFGLRGGDEHLELATAFRSVRNDDLDTNLFDTQTYVGWSPNDDWYWKIGGVTSEYEETDSRGAFLHGERAIIGHFHLLADVGTLEIEELSGPEVTEEKQLRRGVGGMLDELPYDHFLIAGLTDSDDKEMGNVRHLTIGRYTPFWEQGTRLAYVATGNFDDQVEIAMGALAFGTKTALKRNKYEMQWTSKEFFWLATQLKHLNYEYGPAYDDITVENGLAVSAFFLDVEIMPDVHVGEFTLAGYGVWSPDSEIVDKVHAGVAYETATSPVFLESGGFGDETERFYSILAGIHLGGKGQWKLRFKFTPHPPYGEDGFLVSLTFDLLNAER